MNMAARARGALGAAGVAGARFDAVDWHAPWLARYADVGQRVQTAAALGEDAYLEALAAAAHARGLSTGRGRPLRFVPQSALPAGTAYETYIAQTGAVPTRHNLHDTFNALAWFAYPRIKAALNALQADALDAAGVGPVRGKLRDALTLLDERALLFACADPVLADALRGFDWSALMLEHRPAWGVRCEAWLFGHALQEKLVRPYKACTAHAWIVEVEPGFFARDAAARRAELDARVSRMLSDGALNTQRFAPLPVLGIPGWWGANENPAFYDDPQVFRRGRRVTCAAG